MAALCFASGVAGNAARAVARKAPEVAGKTVVATVKAAPKVAGAAAKAAKAGVGFVVNRRKAAKRIESIMRRSGFA